MDEAMRRVLAERAAHYARPAETVVERPGLEYLGVRLGPLTVAVPVARVHELAPLSGWTALSGQRHLLGLLQWRGEVMALVDLQDALGAGPAQRHGLALVVQARGGRAAVPVDEVVGHRRVVEDEVLAVPPGGVEGRRVTKDLWVLLDADELEAALQGRSLPAAGAGRATG